MVSRLALDNLDHYLNRDSPTRLSGWDHREVAKKGGIPVADYTTIVLASTLLLASMHTNMDVCCVCILL